MMIARLQCMEVPFLTAADALGDLTSEMQIFTAMYQYRRCKMFAASGQEATSPGQASNVWMMSSVSASNEARESR